FCELCVILCEPCGSKKLLKRFGLRSAGADFGNNFYRQERKVLLCAKFYINTKFATLYLKSILRTLRNSLRALRFKKTS
ncbi:hypothetical protein ACHRVW_23290, partial [Flavobacterium collinsii]|uniref:hypothetical protein n=1 Tax=Flavobacterium collinsii TaxID=1114861 RepID=UPI003757B0FD